MLKFFVFKFQRPILFGINNISYILIAEKTFVIGFLPTNKKIVFFSLQNQGFECREICEGQHNIAKFSFFKLPLLIQSLKFINKEFCVEIRVHLCNLVKKNAFYQTLVLFKNLSILEFVLFRIFKKIRIFTKKFILLNLKLIIIYYIFKILILSFLLRRI